jgi:predicted benzoate:H+ symporter BenE
MGRIASLITALLLVMGTTVIGAARSATAPVWWAWDDPVLVING